MLVATNIKSGVSVLRIDVNVMCWDWRSFTSVSRGLEAT